MATVLEVRDELWDVLEPLIRPVKVPAKQGRRPVPDRVCFNAIVFVLVTGIAWAHLPMAELNCADRPEDNVGALHAMLYGLSLLYCMTTTLAHDGAGLGACGLPEARVRELCTEIGFSTVRIPPPFTSLASIENIVYEVRP